MQSFNHRVESTIQEFVILDLEESRIFFKLFHLPHDIDSFIIQISCKWLDLYLKIPQNKSEKHSRAIYYCALVPTETSCGSCLIRYLILTGCVISSI